MQPGGRLPTYTVELYGEAWRDISSNDSCFVAEKKQYKQINIQACAPEVEQYWENKYWKEAFDIFTHNSKYFFYFSRFFPQFSHVADINFVINYINYNGVVSITHLLIDKLQL